MRSDRHPVVCVWAAPTQSRRSRTYRPKERTKPEDAEKSKEASEDQDTQAGIGSGVVTHEGQGQKTDGPCEDKTRRKRSQTSGYGTCFGARHRASRQETNPEYHECLAQEHRAPEPQWDRGRTARTELGASRSKGSRNRWPDHQGVVRCNAGPRTGDRNTDKKQEPVPAHSGRRPVHLKSIMGRWESGSLGGPHRSPGRTFAERLSTPTAGAPSPGTMAG